MGIFDKAKDLVGEHNEQIDQGIDKAADVVDEKTGGSHTEEIDQGADVVKGALDDFGGQA